MIWLDWVILIIIVVSIVRGYFLGLVKTLLGAIQYVVSFGLIYFTGPQVGAFLTRPLHLTDTIAESLRDIVTLPAGFFHGSYQVSLLSDQLSQGAFPYQKFITDLFQVVNNMDIPPALRHMLVSMLQKNQTVGFLMKTAPDLQQYPIHNLGDLAIYSLSSIIANFIAVAVGTLVITVVVACITYFIIALTNKMSKDLAPMGIVNRWSGAIVNGVACFIFLLLVLQIVTPMLCFFTIDPNNSLLVSTIMNKTSLIWPWLQSVLMKM